VQDTEAMLQQLYRETCDEYNRSPLAVTGGYYHEPNDFTLLQLKEVVKRLPATGGVFLDIGTGCGIIPRAIHKLGARSITVDWSATGTDDAIVNARAAGVEGYYCQVGYELLPIEESSVDCVLLADVIEHLLHSPKPVLQDIRRVLKERGGCIATTPNALRLAVRAKVALGYSNWPPVMEYFDAPFHVGHHHEYTIQEFRGAFRRSGFVEETFLLHETRLGRTPIASFADIRTRSRREPRGQTPTALRILSSTLALLTTLIPQLRSEMLLVVSKR